MCECVGGGREIRLGNELERRRNTFNKTHVNVFYIPPWVNVSGKYNSSFTLTSVFDFQREVECPSMK